MSEGGRKILRMPQVFFPEKSYGQRRLAGYSPRGCKESHTTQQLNNDNSKQRRTDGLMD